MVLYFSKNKFVKKYLGLDDKGKERIYKTIETLLPKAMSTDTKNLK